MPAPSEFEIQRALCLWLDGTPTRAPALIPGPLYWHTPNGGARGGLEAKRFKESGVKSGIFDLSFLWGGLYVLELKDESGKLSDAQRAMWKRYETAGAAGIAVCNSLASARAQLFAWGLVRAC